MNTNKFMLSYNDLRKWCQQDEIMLEDIEDLADSKEMIGQERAVSAINFGIDIEGYGYNIFVAGPSGVGKTTAIKNMLETKASRTGSRKDWIYVYNFDKPPKPQCIKLSPGLGRDFKADMSQFVKEMKQEIGSALESDLYENEKEKLTETLQDKKNERLNEIQQEAHRKNFAIQQAPQGLIVVPIKDGKPLKQEEYMQLEPSQKNKIDKDRQELQKKLSDIVKDMHNMDRKLRKQIEDLQKEIVKNSISHLVNELKSKYEEYERICKYLDKVRNDILDNITVFNNKEDEQKGNLMAPMMNQQQKQSSSVEHRYKVNVFIDNSKTEGVPVIIENNPTFKNLFGRIERQVQMGALVTDFTMIKNGALHRANGGYLIIKAEDVLKNPYSWEGLKRTLMEQKISIMDLTDEYGLINTVNLDPEPITCDVKVVLIGTPYIYSLMHTFDEEFRELFKIKADFGVQMDRNSKNIKKVALFIHNYCKSKELPEFDEAGIRCLVEHSSETVENKNKLSTKFSRLCNIIEEASHWCKKRNGNFVSGEDVEKALKQKIYRANLVEDRLLELIEDNTIFIDVEGEAVGQVNGLSISYAGDYSFGRPSLITARTYVGQKGLINIEREADLSGKIHNKGVLTISGYLSGKYGQDKPVSLSASIAFEQNYNTIDGDSASCAEIYSILSSLSEIPIKQSIAVTGSINQMGKVQPVGGVKEKIEGFYKACKLQGLNSKQGVIIPRANVKNLMLDKEIIDSVEKGNFFIYAIEHVEEGLEILTGHPVGTINKHGEYPENSINYLVDKKLIGYNKINKKQQEKA